MSNMNNRNKIDIIRSMLAVDDFEQKKFPVSHMAINQKLYDSKTDDEKAAMLARHFCNAWSTEVFIRPDCYDIPECIRDKMWNILGSIGCLTKDELTVLISEWLSELYTERSKDMYRYSADRFFRLVLCHNRFTLENIVAEKDAAFDVELPYDENDIYQLATTISASLWSRVGIEMEKAR